MAVCQQCHQPVTGDSLVCSQCGAIVNLTTKDKAARIQKQAGIGAAIGAVIGLVVLVLLSVLLRNFSLWNAVAGALGGAAIGATIKAAWEAIRWH